MVNKLITAVSQYENETESLTITEMLETEGEEGQNSSRDVHDIEPEMPSVSNDMEFFV